MNQLILAMLLIASGSIRFTEADDCNPNPCKNGATCRLLDAGYNWGYVCTCAPGYRGYQCQWDSVQCSADTKTPCQNGGQCVINQDGRFCKCPGDTDTTIRFGGHYCEIENPCASCPSGTVYCNAAQTSISGRMCLDAGHMKLR